MTVLAPNVWILVESSGRVSTYGEDGDTAAAPVAIVLGAAVYGPGDPSPWLKYRLETAAGLYSSGRVDAILVSGDNGRVGYDEPTAMRDYLVSQGRNWVRERPAAVKAAWDVITRREPLLGERETSVDEALAFTRARRGG